MKRTIICILLALLALTGCRERPAEQIDYLQVAEAHSINGSASDSPLDEIDFLNSSGQTVQKERSQVHTLSCIIFLLAVLLLLSGVALRLATLSKRELSEKNQDLCRIVQRLTSGKEPAPGASPAEPEEEQNPRRRLFRRICDLMQEETPYTDSSLKREDLARMLGTNYNNVAEAIRECSDGQTLSEFLDDFRLRHAARMLADLDEPIGLISEMSGFQSRGHFNTLFREKYEMTPSEYRKAIQDAGSV